MTKYDFPCVSCITLPVCKNRMDIEIGLIFSQLLELSRYCSILADWFVIYDKNIFPMNTKEDYSKSLNKICEIMDGSLI